MLQVDPLDLAVRTWAVAYGLVWLVAAGPLPVQALEQAAPVMESLSVGFGGEPGRCQASVARGWAAPRSSGA